MFLLCVAGAAVFFDILYQKIPNGLVAAGLLGGLAYQTVCFRGPGILAYAAGVLLPVALLGAIYYFRMIGAGDIKLLAVICGHLGPAMGLECMIYTFLIGGAISAVLLIKRKNLFSRFFYLKTYIFQYIQTKEWSPYIRAEDQDGRFPFSIPVFGGLVITLGQGGAWRF